MLTEEAHHMFVGETGVGRVIKRTLEVMKELGTDDVATLRNAGVIDLPTVQQFMNFWFTTSLDLFGSEVSSNAANSFSNGIKGRPDEAKFPDHVEAGTEMTIQVPDGRGGLASQTITVRNGINEITRLEYAKDCNVGVTRWNMGIKRAGVAFELKLPIDAFPPPGRRLGRHPHHAGRPADQPGRVRSAQGRVAAHATATSHS